jgi:hypothetical protein
MEEVYKPIEGYENYEISNFGNVKNIKTNTIKKSCIGSSGYYDIELFKNNKRKHFLLHRLVALTFIENPENKYCVDHIDRNKTNNNVNNLRWASLSENNMNIGLKSHNKSTCSGVFFDKKLNKWVVHININKVQKHVGVYTSFEDAVKARKKQETIYYKEFQAI